MKNAFSRLNAFKPFTLMEQRALEFEQAIKKHGLGTKKLHMEMASIIDHYLKMEGK